MFRKGMPEDLPPLGPPPQHCGEMGSKFCCGWGRPPLSLLATLRQLTCSGEEHLMLNPVATLTIKAVAHNYIHRHIREAGNEWNFFRHLCPDMFSLDIIWSYIRKLKYLLKYFSFFFYFQVTQYISNFDLTSEYWWSVTCWIWPPNEHWSQKGCKGSKSMHEGWGRLCCCYT